MKGWTEQRGIVAKPGRVIWRCDADLCGAQVGVDPGGKDRRPEHDRQFHLLRLESGGGGQEGHEMYLDSKIAGRVRVKRETWNLIRLVVSETWVAYLNIERRTVPVGGHQRLRDTMQDVLRETGAKAWGRGKNPKVWHYPEERR